MSGFSVTTRYDRRICPVQYEHIEAETSITASVEEGSVEDAAALASSLMTVARDNVRAGLKGGAVTATTTVETKTATGTTTEVKQPAEAEKPKRGRPPAAAAKAADKPADAPKPAVDEFGEPVATAEAEKPAAVVAVAADDEFEAAAPVPVEEKPLSANDLQSWLSSNIQAKKVAVADVKSVLKKYGADRTADTKDADRNKIKAEVTALLKG